MLSGVRASTLAQPEYETPDPARLADTVSFERRVFRVALQRMDNVGIVVESLDAAISFRRAGPRSSKGEP